MGSQFQLMVQTTREAAEKLKLLKLKAMSTQMCFRMNSENMNLTAAFIELAHATRRCISEAWNGDSGPEKVEATPHGAREIESQRRT